MMILDVDSQHSKGREAYKFGIVKANLPVLSLSIAELLQFCSESVGHCIACFLRCHLLDNANYDMFSKDEWAISLKNRQKLRLVTNGDFAWVENSCQLAPVDWQLLNTSS